MPSNRQIAETLEMLAEMMELAGENRFRMIAHQNAAHRVAESDFSIAKMAREGRLTELPDIGESIAAKIEEIVSTGRLAELDEYKKRFPADLVRLQKVQGVGPKTALKVWQELGVSSLDELQEAARDGRVAALPGMGKKTEENIIKAAGRLKKRGIRVLIGEAMPVAEEIVGRLKALPEAQNVTAAGSVRRMKETVKDIDIIATAADPEALTEAFSALPLVDEVIGKGPTKCSIRTHTGLQVDLRVVPGGQYGDLLQHFTGSKEHNVALRERAISRGLKVSEYGVKEAATGQVHECATEEEVYRLLGLDYIPPELRENRGEIEAAAAGSLPALIEEADLKGDMHVHSDWSDGHASICEMALAAKERGLEYIVISDHSQSLAVARGLTPGRLKEQRREIDAINAESEGFHVFTGMEVDVKADGSLDLPDEDLAALDFVTVSIHSGFSQGREQIMQRLEAAMAKPFVRLIGHPTGRLLNRRDPYEIDVERLIEVAAGTGTALEINSHFWRLDLDDVHARSAREAGVKLAINSDAHAPGDLDLLRYGVATARRGWLEPDNVINTLPLAELRQLLARPKAATAGG